MERCNVRGRRVLRALPAGRDGDPEDDSRCALRGGSARVGHRVDPPRVSARQDSLLLPHMSFIGAPMSSRRVRIGRMLALVCAVAMVGSIPWASAATVAEIAKNPAAFD